MHCFYQYVKIQVQQCCIICVICNINTTTNFQDKNQVKKFTVIDWISIYLHIWLLTPISIYHVSISCINIQLYSNKAVDPHCFQLCEFANLLIVATWMMFGIAIWNWSLRYMVQFWTIVATYFSHFMHFEQYCWQYWQQYCWNMSEQYWTKV